MADTIKLRKELILVAKELGLSGEEIASYVSKEMDRERQREEGEREFERQRAERERQREEGEREREREEREKDREHEVRIKQMEIEARRSTRSRSGSEERNVDNRVDQAMLFQLENFNDKLESVDIYLDRFETLAREFNLDPAKWNLKLSQALRGSAYDTYNKLPVSKKDDFYELKDALLRRYELTAEAYKKKFRNMKKDKNETVSHFVDRLDTCLNKWITLSPFEKTYNGLFELILTEQVNDILPQDVRTFFMAQGAQKLSEITQHADRYLNAQEVNRSHKLNGGGVAQQIHSEKPDIEHRPSTRNGSTNHISRPHTNRHPNARPNDRRQKYCTNCHRDNHNADECRRPRQPNTRTHTAATCVVASSDNTPQTTLF